MIGIIFANPYITWLIRGMGLLDKVHKIIVVGGSAPITMDMVQVMGTLCPIWTSMGTIYRATDSLPTLEDHVSAPATTPSSPTTILPSSATAPTLVPPASPAPAPSDYLDQFETSQSWLIATDQREAEHLGIPLPPPPLSLDRSTRDASINKEDLSDTGSIESQPF